MFNDCPIIFSFGVVVKIFFSICVYGLYTAMFYVAAVTMKELGPVARWLATCSNMKSIVWESLVRSAMVMMFGM